MRIQKKKRTDLSNQRKWISKKNSRSMFCVVSILSLGCTVFPRNNLIKSVAICIKFIIFRMLKNMYILIGFFSVVFLFLFCRHQLPPKSPQTFNSIWNVFLESKNIQPKTECTWSNVHFFIMFWFPLINKIKDFHPNSICRCYARITLRLETMSGYDKGELILSWQAGNPSPFLPNTRYISSWRSIGLTL